MRFCLFLTDDYLFILNKSLILKGNQQKSIYMLNKIGLFRVSIAFIAVLGLSSCGDDEVEKKVDTVQQQLDKEEEEAKKRLEEEEAAKKLAEEEAAKKLAEEEAAKKLAEEEAKKLEEEAKRLEDLKNLKDETNPEIPSFIAFQDDTPSDKKWVKYNAMSDEFDRWDSAKWFKSLWNYGVPVNMKAENSGVTEGNLWIKATLGTGDRWFHTSRVQSRAQIKFPMYTECRIKTAHISAYNTFWLNNGDINNRDEIDIIENNSKPTYKGRRGSFNYEEYPWQMSSQYFIVKNGVTERAKGNFSNKNLSEGNPLRGVRWNEAYHIVGAWWKDKNTVQYYLDGEPAGSITTRQDFTIKQSLIWDLWTENSDWVGGNAIQSDLSDDSINTMKVDWVRTWKLEDK